MALSLQTTKPATPSKFNPFGNTSTGLIGSINRAVGFSTPQAPAPVQQGTNQGQLPPVSHPQPNPNLIKSQTTTPGGPTTTTYHPDPLAANKKIQGDKTKAAQSYKPPTSQTNSTPTPSDYSGNNPSAHGFVGTQNTAPEPSIPNSQPQTPTYNQTNPGLYGQVATDLANRSTQSGPEYQAAIAEANRIQDQQTALAKEYSQNTNNIAGTAGFLTQQSGLQGQQNNQYNTVQGALSSQYAGATNRLGAANTQQGLQQSALSTAGSMAAPKTTGPTDSQYNPTTNTYGQSAATGGYNGGGLNGVGTMLGNYGASQNFAGKYQEGLAGITAGDKIASQINNTLSSNPNINSDSFTFLTNLNKFLSKETGTAPQQLLAQQVKSYLDSIGLDQSEAANISSQQKGTLKQLLSSLRTTAINKNNVYAPGSIGGNTGGSNNNSGSPTGGYKNGGAF